MHILFVTHQIPNKYSGADIRPFHLLKIFKKKYNYDISLISFKENIKSDDIKEIEKHCNNTLFFPIISSNNKKILIKETIQNLFSFKNIFSRTISNNGSFDIGFYNRKYIQKEIDDFIANHGVDIIYSDASMAGYISNSDLPKIIEPLDINYRNFFNYFKNEKGIFNKTYWFMFFLKTLYREICLYRKFDYCVLVTETDKKNIDKYLLNIKIIPNGTDIYYFKPIRSKSHCPSLIFTGVMNGKKNVEAVLYFYSKIYYLIKKNYKEIMFYIVGKNPSPNICELATKDPSVIITGFVKDMRPYLSKSSVFICPHISGSGIKNKILEAMAMEKPVVTTSIGILGIDALPGKDLIVANKPKDFAKAIKKLLDNEELRKEIGMHGRKLVETKYSWEKTGDMLNELFIEVVNNSIR